MKIIEFPGRIPYPVYVDTNFDSIINSLCAGYSRIAIVSAKPMIPVAQRVQLLAQDSQVAIFETPDAEEGKTLAVAEKCWDFFAENRISRTDLVIGIGGGAVTDLTNFVSATWLRGTDVVLIPTTVLAMVDASIGGKSGLNTGFGKNLVGIFNDPKAVVCNPDFLSTLDPKDFRAGIAEVIKCGFIADSKIVNIILSHPKEVMDFRSNEFQEILVRAISVKSKVVADDPFEKAENGVGRAALNYGHTLGHAIEKQSGYRWRHGEAISVGMVFAAELAFQLAMIDEKLRDLHYQLLEQFGLPTRYQSATLADLLPIMSLDKKVSQGKLRFVLLDEIGKPVFVTDPAPDTLATAFNRLGRD